MKKLFAILFACALTVALAGPASADSASGGSWVGGAVFDGDFNTGGVATFEGGGQYGAIGIFNVGGWNDAYGGAIADADTWGNYQDSIAGAFVYNDGGAWGILAGTQMYGDVAQATWANVGSPWTVASTGQQSTASFYSADIALFGVAQDDGFCGVLGGSEAWQMNGPFTSQAYSRSWNIGAASGDLSSVQGSGDAMTGAQRVGMNGACLATSQGHFSYSGNNLGAGQTSSYSAGTLIEGPSSIYVNSYTTSNASSGGF